MPATTLRSIAITVCCLGSAGLGLAMTSPKSSTDSTPAVSAAVVHPSLALRFSESAEPVKAWVYFTDKGHATDREQHLAIQQLEGSYNDRAIERRRLRRTAPGLFDARDLPVSADYVDAVTATGAKLHVTSRWLNAVSVYLSREQADAVAKLPFVRSIEPVRRGRRIEPHAPDDIASIIPPAERGLDFYGFGEAQLAQINLIALHEAGATADGIIIGVLDTGFKREHIAFNEPGHEIDVLAEWDFINNDGDTSIEPGDYEFQHSHGTLILGVLGAYLPGQFVGAAYDASFILCKTEDVTDEYPAEEDNYVGGLEFIEENGGDVATSSLGYIDWYTQDDLDGLTAVTTIAVNIATANGIFCCTAAGNEGHDSNPGTSHLLAPADALQVIACGAVEITGEIAGFSSDGPSADGRVKPEVLAQGVDTVSITTISDDGYQTANGTSLSTPLVAGAVACMVQAKPAWTVDQLRNMLFTTADYYMASGTFDPQYVYGYGVLDAYGAATSDCNDNGVRDDIDIDEGTSLDENGNGIPDECEEPVCPEDINGDATVDVLDLLAVLADWGMSGTPADVNDDGIVDILDLLAVLGAWGPC